MMNSIWHTVLSFVPEDHVTRFRALSRVSKLAVDDNLSIDINETSSLWMPHSVLEAASTIKMNSLDSTYIPDQNSNVKNLTLRAVKGLVKLPKFRNLQYLSLSSMDIPKLEVPDTLKELSLDYCGTVQLSGGANIQHLSLHKSYIKDFPIGIQSLYLSNISIEKIDFSKMKFLTKLSCSSLVTAAIESIPPHLETLNLSDTCLRTELFDTPLKHFTISQDNYDRCLCQPQRFPPTLQVLAIRGPCSRSLLGCCDSGSASLSAFKSTSELESLEISQDVFRLRMEYDLFMSFSDSLTVLNLSGSINVSMPSFPRLESLSLCKITLSELFYVNASLVNLTLQYLDGPVLGNTTSLCQLENLVLENNPGLSHKSIYLQNSLVHLQIESQHCDVIESSLWSNPHRLKEIVLRSTNIEFPAVSFPALHYLVLDHAPGPFISLSKCIINPSLHAFELSHIDVSEIVHAQEFCPRNNYHFGAGRSVDLAEGNRQSERFLRDMEHRRILELRRQELKRAKIVLPVGLKSLHATFLDTCLLIVPPGCALDELVLGRCIVRNDWICLRGIKNLTCFDNQFHGRPSPNYPLTNIGTVTMVLSNDLRSSLLPSLTYVDVSSG